MHFPVHRCYRSRCEILFLWNNRGLYGNHKYTWTPWSGAWIPASA